MPGEKKRVAFLDLLIECAENGVVLSDEEVREQVDTIMFEVSLGFWILHIQTIIIALKLNDFEYFQPKKKKNNNYASTPNEINIVNVRS